MVDAFSLPTNGASLNVLHIKGVFALGNADGAVEI